MAADAGHAGFSELLRAAFLPLRPAFIAKSEVLLKKGKVSADGRRWAGGPAGGGGSHSPEGISVDEDLEGELCSGDVCGSA